MTGNIHEDIQNTAKLLGTDINFDVVRRNLTIGGREAVLFFVDGFIKDEVYEKIMEFLFKITPDEISKIHNMSEFSKIKMPYVEVDWSSDDTTIVTAVLSGQSCIMIEGIKDALLVDTRTYPMRGIKEPEKDRSLRGSRDSFVETFVFNTALIRRRIRDNRLRMEYMQVGIGSKVDVAISYIDGVADQKVVKELKKRLKSVKISGISMTLQALSEAILPSFCLNPFPKIRYTERPDFASACILEGKVVLIMDNCPSVMIFPVSFADFSKEADDYYFPSVSGSYVRIIRLLVSLLTVILTPIMLILINNPQIVPPWLDFLLVRDKHSIPIFIQFLILEFVIDGLRLASINTPSSLSNSLGIIGGLLLSEFAIDVGWFIPETVIYMSFVAISSFAQPSFEMAYAMKYERVFLLILSQFFGFVGFFIGIALIIIAMASVKTLSGRGYLYPIIPFNALDFRKLFVRTRIKNEPGKH